MADSTMCKAWLNAIKANASSETRKKFRGHAILGDSSGWTIELADGTQFEMGRQHCKLCALAQAMVKENADE
jgi:hypothetical protein